MSTGPAAVGFLVDVPVGWSVDWDWGLPPDRADHPDPYLPD